MARADRDDQFCEIRNAALEQGWQVIEAQTRWKFIPPDKSFSPIFYPSTIKDWRAVKNFRAAMRQRGFILPERLRKGA